MELTRISVAMTTCNGAPFLLKQLESLATQVMLPDELVVADDASTDHTVDVLYDFEKAAPFPVKIIRHAERLGFRENFMVCAEHCSGELVAFCDQDDIWVPEKLSTQVSDFDDRDIMMSCHNADLINGVGAKLNGQLNQFRETCRVDLVSAGPSTFARGFTQVVRKSLFKWEWLRRRSLDIGDPRQIMSHDGWMFFVALLHGSIAYHAEPLALHRQHGGNTSGAIPSRLERLRWRLKSQPSTYARLAQAWTNRRDLLQLLLEEETDCGDLVKARILQAHQYYSRSALAASRRLELHSRKSRFARAQTLAQSLATGDFRSKDPWRFPLEGALKDSVAILFNWREGDQNVS